MPNFEEFFIESRGKPISYNGMELFTIDRIPVNKKFSGTVRLISTNSEWKQAIRLTVTKGKLRINADREGEAKSVCLWEEYLQKGDCHFEGTTRDLELIVHNAWEQFAWTDRPFTNFWKHGAAMIVEVDGSTRRYRCNDGHPDDNFDDIVFEIVIND
jgi:hypothetical protein